MTTRIVDIIAIAARLSGVSVKQIKGSQRSRHIARVRQAICHVAASQGVHNFSEIGRRIGLDHSTVMYANRVAPENAARDPEYAHFIARLRAEVEAAAPFLEGWGEQYEFTMAHPAKPRPSTKPPAAPKPRTRRDDEPIYYGGGYSMNREAAA